MVVKGTDSFCYLLVVNSNGGAVLSLKLGSMNDECSSIKKY